MKNTKGKGWHNDPYKHGLASRGIETKSKGKAKRIDGLKIHDYPYIDDVWDLTDIGFEPLAWKEGISHLFYNPERKILVRNVEGDMTVWKDPSESTIEREVKRYSKAHVSLGEHFDRRFDTEVERFKRRGDENEE